MNTHTQEPWKVSTSRSLEIVDASGVALLEMWHRGNPDKEQADARRIVACVNACAGLETDFLLSSPNVCFKANTTECASIMIENVTLKQQRDELLAALQDLLDMQDVPDSNCSCHINPPCSDCVNYGGIRESIECAIKAIAKARGVQL